MKTKLKQSKAQARLEIRHGALCVLVETPFSAGRSGAAAPGMRQWYRVAEPPLDPALVARRPVRSIDPSEGLFVDEEGNSYRLAGGGEATPEYAEVIPAVNGQATQAKAGASVDGRHRHKGEEKAGAIDPFPEPPPRACVSGTWWRSPLSTQLWSLGARCATSIRAKGYSWMKKGTAIGWPAGARPRPNMPR